MRVQLRDLQTLLHDFLKIPGWSNPARPLDNRLIVDTLNGADDPDIPADHENVGDSWWEGLVVAALVLSVEERDSEVFLYFVEAGS